MESDISGIGIEQAITKSKFMKILDNIQANKRLRNKGHKASKHNQNSCIKRILQNYTDKQTTQKRR